MTEHALTAREREVMEQLLHAGGTNAQIAHALHLSEKTVKAHLASAFRKLGVRSRAAAVLAFIGHSPEELATRLLSLLENYGRHHEWCATTKAQLRSCDCGFEGHLRKAQNDVHGERAA